jgi:O-antigen/teichoic acid export membrane protein
MNSLHSHKSIIKETVVYGVGTFVAQVISALRGMMVAGFLGPVEYGFWKVIQVGLDYLGYSHAGFLHGMARQLPVYRQRGEDKEDACARLSVFRATLLTAALAGAGAVICTAGRPRSTWFAWIGLAALLIPVQLFRYQHMICLADGRFAVLSMANLLMAVFSFAVMWLVIPWWGLYGVFAGLGVGYGSGLVFGWIRGIFPPLWRAGPPPLAGAERLRVLKDLLWTGFPFMCADGLFVVWQGADRLALASIHGARSEALGYYGLAVMIASFAIQIPQVVSRVLFRRTVRAFGGQDDGDQGVQPNLQKHLELPTLALAGWTPILLGLCLIGSRAVIHLYLPGYREAVASTALLLMACYWSGIGLLVRNVYTATNRQWRLGIIYLATITVCLGAIYGDWWLGGGEPRLGILAGALGMLLGSVCYAVLSILDNSLFLEYEFRQSLNLVGKIVLAFIPYALWSWWLVATRGEWGAWSGATFVDMAEALFGCAIACGPMALLSSRKLFRSR